MAVAPIKASIESIFQPSFCDRAMICPVRSADDGDGHHGDADGISMKAGCRTVDPHGRCCQRAKTDDDADTADCHNSSAGALYEDEKQAGEVFALLVSSICRF